MASIGNAVSEKMFEYYGHIHVFIYSTMAGAEEKMFKHCEQRQWWTTEHGYTISSPCEPNGLGEQIKPL